MLAKVATLQEVETQWSIDDLMDCHEALDIELEYMNKESKRIEAEAKKGTKKR